MALRTVHVKMRTEEISALDLLAEKDRRRPAELVRFAVEEYVERRASEVAVLRNEKLGRAKVKGGRSELRGNRVMLGRVETKGDTETELLARIERLEKLAKAKGA